jgi:diaminopimelate decarboxylase
LENGTSNGRGHLTWGGGDTTEMAATYGTPLYIMDEDILVARMRRYLEAGRAAYDKLQVAYAGKAFLCGALVQLVSREGLWLDVVSGGELQLALASGMPPERILFHGNNKSPDELSAGLEGGVGRFVVDNTVEMERLSRLAAAAGRIAEIQIRITPGISPRTHRAVQTGQVDSKFGFAIADGMALAAIERALSLPGLKVVGLHCHIGSQIHDLAPFKAAARAAARLAWEVWERTGFLAPEINLGGGWAAEYLPSDGVAALEVYLASVVSAFRLAWRRHGTPGVALGGPTAASVATGELGSRGRYTWPHLFVEPGRSIVAEAGITLYTVGAVKPVPGHDSYVMVDGGMADNPRPLLYDSKYHAVLANRADEQPAGTYTLAGKACESGDILIRRVALPAPRPGDLVAVFATGAYNHSMSSNYNRLPRPAVVFASKGQARLAVRRESYADLLRCDLIAGTDEPVEAVPAPRLHVAAGADPVADRS